MVRWQTGLAEVVEVKGKHITVRCPHCGEQHQHGRGMLGSRNVVAGCHAGPTLLREYRIPDGRTDRPTAEHPSPRVQRKPARHNAIQAA